MTQTVSVFEAHQTQNRRKLYLSLNPLVRVDKIVSLGKSEYRVYYHNALASAPKMDYDNIFVREYNWAEKLWRKIAS